MTFKAKPEPLRALPELPDPGDVARFAAGAVTRAVDSSEATPPDAAMARTTKATKATKAKLPWENLDKEAKPLSGINLRLNEYEHELLKFLAESDERSIQQIIKRLLIPAAEAAAVSIRSSKT